MREFRKNAAAMIYEFSTAPAALPRKTDLIRLAAIFVSCIFIKTQPLFWDGRLYNWHKLGLLELPREDFWASKFPIPGLEKKNKLTNKILHPWVFKVKNCEFCLEIQKVISIMISVSVLHLNSISIF